jgi:hypothetical protein
MLPFVASFVNGSFKVLPFASVKLMRLWDGICENKTLLSLL